MVMMSYLPPPTIVYAMMSDESTGTNQLAEKGFIYDDSRYNDIQPLGELAYNGIETIVSPDGMVDYENYDSFKKYKIKAW